MRAGCVVRMLELGRSDDDIDASVVLYDPLVVRQAYGC